MQVGCQCFCLGIAVTYRNSSLPDLQSSEMHISAKHAGLERSHVLRQGTQCHVRAHPPLVFFYPFSVLASDGMSAPRLNLESQSC